MAAKEILEDGNLFCLDWENIEFSLHGDRWSGQSYSSIDIMLVPCATQFRAYDGSTFGGGDECEWDKEKVVDYLGDQINLITIYNSDHFDAGAFNG